MSPGAPSGLAFLIRFLRRKELCGKAHCKDLEGPFQPHCLGWPLSNPPICLLDRVGCTHPARMDPAELRRVIGRILYQEGKDIGLGLVRLSAL